MSTYLYDPAGFIPAGDVLARFRVAQTMRQNWENVWQDCADYTLPYRSQTHGGLQRNAKIFDATAGDCIDQLASSLLAQLTPPWSSWIAVMPGPHANDDDIKRMAPVLKEINEILQGRRKC